MQTTNRVTVKTKHVYGKLMVYPVNTTAHLLCKLIGTKTLSLDNLNLIKQLGFTIESEMLTVDEMFKEIER